MDLLQLRYFCHAAESENFSGTARAFYVPPSAVSISIKKLETELGTPLFTRTANRIRLNPQGRYYYDCVRQALTLIDDSSRVLQEGGQTEQIRVGVRLGRRKTLHGIDLFREQYPDIEVIYSKFGPDSRLEDYDIVMSDETLEHENYAKITVLRDKLVLVAGKGYLPKGELSVDFLREQTYVSPSRTNVIYLNTLKVCRDLGFEPKIVTSPQESVYFAAHKLEMGEGVAITYPKAVWLSFMAHLVEMRDIGDYYHTVCCYCRKKNAPPHTPQLYEAIISNFV